MGSKLQRVNREATETYEEDGDFVVFRKELTRGEMGRLMRLFPQQREDGTRDLEQASAFMEEFFDLVKVKWSLADVDEEGNETPVPISVQAYRDLEASSGFWVDAQLNAHMPIVMNAKEAEGESIS